MVAALQYIQHASTTQLMCERCQCSGEGVVCGSLKGQSCQGVQRMCIKACRVQASVCDRQQGRSVRRKVGLGVCEEGGDMMLF